MNCEAAIYFEVIFAIECNNIATFKTNGIYVCYECHEILKGLKVIEK
jgi:hypothetical protein